MRRAHPPKPGCLAENLRKLRDSTGLSQVDFAKAIKVSPSLVSAWEASRIKSISDRNKRRIQKALGLTDQAVFEIFYRLAAPPRPVVPPDISARAARLPEADQKRFWGMVRSLLAAEEARTGTEAPAA